MDGINNTKLLKYQIQKMLCLKCLFKPNFFNWYNKCKLKHFEWNYVSFPSEHNILDEIFKNNYCESKLPEELI